MKLDELMDNNILNFSTNNLITESGFNKVLTTLKNKDFAIISSYRKKYNKQENILRNRNLRHELDIHKMGVYHLVGHWQECQDEDVPYNMCPKNKLIDVVERSYLVPRSEKYSREEFQQIILNLLVSYEQDAAIVSFDGQIYILEQDGNVYQIAEEVTLNKVGQAYSQYVKKMEVPFVFEGVEVPSSISGHMVLSRSNTLYPKGDFSDYKTIKNM